MKSKKIQTKMLATILPVIVVAFVAIIMVAGFSVTNLSSTQIDETMQETRQANINEVNSQLKDVKTMADVLSATVANTYQTLSLTDYEELIAETIQQNDMVLGSGIWFEPYVYDETQEYVGPYIFKDGDDIAVTYDYSNADYDYFTQEYYTNAMTSSEAVITDPYYDETSGVIMSSCSTPITVDGTYIGCITVDIELSSITDLIDSIQVGEGGNAFLISSDGIYLAGVDEDKITNITSILDENATIGQMMIDDESGNTTYTDANGTEYSLYYGTIDETGWKIGVQIPYDEIMGPVQSVYTYLTAIGIIALIVSALMILWQVRRISKSIQTVMTFVGNLAEGNFTVDSLKVQTQDELGSMGNSLNNMFDSNKAMIGNISNHSSDIATSSRQLRESSEQLLSQFRDIQTSMDQINDAMLTSSAATEEVNASVEEVSASISVLAAETEQGLQLSEDIQKRASDVEVLAKESSASANQLTKSFEKELAESMENAKVVESVDELANVIASIAGQINLLSLNASIEAARAGEHGKGFAVVATEIGQLANETAEAVGNIQATIGQIQAAFEQLNKSAQEMLHFVTDTVTPDYDKFVDTANQYGDDAKVFADISGKISSMSNDIQTVMNEVTDAVQSIAESAADTTNISSNIVESVHTASDAVSEVSDMSQAQSEIADDLDSVVQQFQL